MDLPQRIALGMSGGVDSSVAAVLLQRAGYEVVGVTCIFHDDEKSRADADAACEVCQQLGVDHAVADCTAQFSERVVEPFVHAYEEGLTPSPCVGCNATCKLPALLEVADQLECQKVATGHYARVAQLLSNGRYVVKTGLDQHKDQSYMLSMLSQDQLSRLVLPLGGLTKEETRALAHECGLAAAEAPESQDVCFISGDYRDFLKMRGVLDDPGPIVSADGEVLGRHAGLFGYTIGQRKGIGVSAPEPYYVIGKRAQTRELVVGTASQAVVRSLNVDSLNWQAFECFETKYSAMVKLRYRSRAVACIITPEVNHAAEGGVRDRESASSARATVSLLSPQPITAPGQYAVFYEGDTVLGGGIIREVSQV